MSTAPPLCTVSAFEMRALLAPLAASSAASETSSHASNGEAIRRQQAPLHGRTRDEV